MDQFAARRREPILPVQVAMAGDLADREARRQKPRGAELIDDAHEVELLKRAVGEVLAFGNAPELGAAFHQRAGDAPHPELHGKRHANRSATHDHDLKFPHSIPLAPTILSGHGSQRPGEPVPCMAWMLNS
jgi:hypothetical protein